MKIEQIPELFSNILLGNSLVDLLNLSLIYNISTENIYELIKLNKIPIIEDEYIDESSYYVEIDNLPDDFGELVERFKDAGRSEGEDLMYKYVVSLGVRVIPNDRVAIKPKEIDIYMPDNKVGIEYDGLHWHKESSLVYKTNLCDKKGIRLIRFYEDEWMKLRRICKGIISSSLNIYDEHIPLSKCKVLEITEIQYNLFLKNNHIHGTAISLYRLGLVYNNELVYAIGVKKYEKYYILNRICPKLFIHVEGALLKLLKELHKKYPEIEEIYTYADRRTSNVLFYKHIGFKLIKTMPCEYFYIVRGKRIGKFDGDLLIKMLKSKYDVNKTEELNLHDNGYDKIYDCGSYKMKYSF